MKRLLKTGHHSYYEWFLFICRAIGMIGAWAKEPGDYWYAKAPGDRPPVYCAIDNRDTVILFSLFLWRLALSLVVVKHEYRLSLEELTKLKSF